MTSVTMLYSGYSALKLCTLFARHPASVSCKSSLLRHLHLFLIWKLDFAEQKHFDHLQFKNDQKCLKIFYTFNIFHC